LKPYDIVPLIPIIKSAGGIVTDWEGNPAVNGGKVVAAANKRLHGDILSILNS
jgi:myo-inositol-1(or 4)-monophosphatase